MTDGPSDMEIDAYIDGELDVEGRFAVEDYLRRHPEKGGGGPGDMGRRSALQLLARGRQPVPAHLIGWRARFSPPHPRGASSGRRWAGWRPQEWRRWC